MVALKVRTGGSEIPGIINLDKQIVWIQKTDELNDGEIGIFFYNGNAYCKKLLCNKKGTYLISLNDKYEPIEIAEGSTFKTFGRVVS